MISNLLGTIVLFLIFAWDFNDNDNSFKSSDSPVIIHTRWVRYLFAFALTVLGFIRLMFYVASIHVIIHCIATKTMMWSVFGIISGMVLGLFLITIILLILAIIYSESRFNC